MIRQQNIYKDYILKANPAEIMEYVDDFSGLTAGASSVGGWTLTQAGSAGTVAPDVAHGYGGIILLNSGHIDAGDGCNFQMAGNTALPAEGRTIKFESRFKLHDSLDTDFFIGLGAVDTTLVSSSHALTSNAVGVKSFTGDGVLLSGGRKSTTNLTGTGFQGVVDTWYTVKVEIRDTNRARVWINNTCYLDSKNGSYIDSTVALTPSIVVQAYGGGGQPVCLVDYVRFSMTK